MRHFPASLLFAFILAATAHAGLKGGATEAQRVPTPAGPRFTVTFPATARAEAVTGRVYVALSRTNDRPPIQQADTNGVPLFAVNVESLAPGPPSRSTRRRRDIR